MQLNEAQRRMKLYNHNRHLPEFCIKSFRQKLESYAAVQKWGPDGDKMLRFADGSRLLYRKLVNEFQL